MTSFYQVAIIDVDDYIQAVLSYALPAVLTETEVVDRLTAQVQRWCEVHGYTYDDDIYFEHRRLSKTPMSYMVLG